EVPATSHSPTAERWTPHRPISRIRSNHVKRAFATATALALASAAAAQGLFPASAGTSEQAARGQAAYAGGCASCHGTTLDGTQFGPALKGAAFEEHWRGHTRAAFSEKIRTT